MKMRKMIFQPRILQIKKIYTTDFRWKFPVWKYLEIDLEIFWLGHWESSSQEIGLEKSYFNIIKYLHLEYLSLSYSDVFIEHLRSDDFNRTPFGIHYSYSMSHNGP